LLACLWITLSWLSPLTADEPTTLIDRLSQTRALNIEEIIDAQFTQAVTADGFRVANPYGEKATETVERWRQDPGRGEEVCAVHFIDADRTGYELRGFDSSSAAVEAGFIVTHQGRCGSCSSLQDLAVYLAVPDLTTPARQCARRFGLEGKKQCFQEHIGLTPPCAESWAYNARHTRQECLGTCIADYGLLNLMLNRYPGPNTDDSGQLRPCLQCDEDQSGAGFKFSAGRTRRNSGIESAIKRAETEIYPVDHEAYFQHISAQ
jgi:hypothetical protein